MSVCTGVATPAEGLTCFVCDCIVVGRYYTLASCKTQVTKQRLVEKLGHLVGDQYMVVISEDDIICRSCTTMMNNLDRLEKEMSAVRSVILRFLEKKYELEEGELANGKVVLPPTPAHPDLINSAVKKPEPSLPTFHERKKQSAKALNEQEAKSNVWMQCDRCKYTTPYSSFMINHIHKHSEPNKQEEKHKVEEPQVDMMNNERPAELETEAEVVETEEQVSVEGTEAEADVVEENQEEEVAEPGADLEGAVVEMDMGEDNICMVDENGIVLQKVQQSEDGQYFVVEGDIDGTKQMLSVAEDGSVQMVQVMWDDIVAADDNMQF